MTPMSQYTDEQLQVMSQEYTVRGKAAKTEMERRKVRYKNSDAKSKETQKASPKSEPKEAPEDTTEGNTDEPPKETTEDKPKQSPKRTTRKRKTSATGE